MLEVHAGTRLAELLEHRRDEVLGRWVDAIVGSSHPHYRDRSLAEVRSWLEASLDAVVASLTQGSAATVAAHAARVAEARQQHGFDIDEVADAILRLKGAIMPLLAERLGEGSRGCLEEITCLDAALRAMVASFAAHFSTAMQEQEQRLAVLEERQRMARELHDSVSQSLYAVHLYALTVSRLLASGAEVAALEQLGELQSAARQALQEMRLLVYELRPSPLPDMGLMKALEGRLAAVERRSGLAATLVVSDLEPLSPQCEEGLFGIAREALNNALKHGRPRHVEVRLEKTGDRLVLSVTDDGVGFDLDEGQLGGGLGLAGMRERAADLGGELSVASRPGQGTRVAVELPLERLGEGKVGWGGV